MSHLEPALATSTTLAKEWTHRSFEPTTSPHPRRILLCTGAKSPLSTNLRRSPAQCFSFGAKKTGWLSRRELPPLLPDFLASLVLSRWKRKKDLSKTILQGCRWEMEPPGLCVGTRRSNSALPTHNKSITVSLSWIFCATLLKSPFDAHISFICIYSAPLSRRWIGLADNSDTERVFNLCRLLD